MKSILIVLCCLFSFAAIQAQSIAGVWNMGEINATIEIVEKDGVFSGKIIASDNPKAKIGTVMFKDGRPAGDVIKGKLYAARIGRWVDSVMKRDGSILNVKVKAGILRKTFEWEKAG